jgi:hypothetical protein
MGNLTGDPFFAERLADNYRLASNSPCLNNGTNENWMSVLTDLEGKPRILNGTVDMGAYELIPPGDSDGDGLPDQWEWDYSQSLSNMLAGIDVDGDWMVNLDEYRAGTGPTDGQSYLGLTTFTSETGLVVSWRSVTGKLYTISRTTNLATSGAFQPIAADIAGQANSTTYTDTTEEIVGPLFYRIGAQY